MNSRPRSEVLMPCLWSLIFSRSTPPLPSRDLPERLQRFVVVRMVRLLGNDLLVPQHIVLIENEDRPGQQPQFLYQDAVSSCRRKHRGGPKAPLPFRSSGRAEPGDGKGQVHADVQHHDIAGSAAASLLNLPKLQVADRRIERRRHADHLHLARKVASGSLPSNRRPAP